MATQPPIDFSTWTPAQALESLNRAIHTVESKGQRYRIGDREVWRGDLEWMYAERARLTAAVSASNRSGPRFRRVVPL
jgi:hypothetical protein